jgi:hypothetical protein
LPTSLKGSVFGTERKNKLSSKVVTDRELQEVIDTYKQIRLKNKYNSMTLDHGQIK